MVLSMCCLTVSPPITDQRLNSLQVSASHWNRTLKWPLLPFLLVQTTLPPIVRCILTSKARLTAQARDSRIWGSGPTDPFASSSLSSKTLDNTHAAFRLGDVVGITGKRVCKCVQHPHIMTSLSLPNFSKETAGFSIVWLWSRCWCVCWGQHIVDALAWAALAEPDTCTHSKLPCFWFTSVFKV